MDNKHFAEVYTSKIQQEIAQYVDVVSPSLTKESYHEKLDVLEDIEVIFSGWGAPVFDKEFLDKVPNLKFIFYAAGTMKKLITDEVWKRNIKVTTANKANAVPVAEFTLSQILFSLKNGWSLSREYKQEKVFQRGGFPQLIGAYESTVGIISLSQIGRKTVELLQHFNLNVLAYDPFATKEEAEKLNVKLVTIDEVFAKADVVSLHAPLLPDTREMITGEHFRMMKKHATFINTARGAIVKEDELIEVFQERQDLTALLDVTFPEPPNADSLLYTLPNIVITPHIAGSAGNETGRLGAFMLAELKRMINDLPLEHEITKRSYENMA